VKPGSHVLDCGCGRGGDWWKWKSIGARVTAIDPDRESLIEARSRAETSQLDVDFLGEGTIIQAAFAGTYDVVCYNFSLHYIVDDWDYSIKALKLALDVDGLLIGITPEKARAEAMSDEHGHFQDDLGNEFDIYHGGRRLMIRLSDGPFYADGAKDEPLLDANIFRQTMEIMGFELLTWEPMLEYPSGRISDLYSKFAFRKIK
jgi:SAM-dependent methyltransferase